MKRKTLFFVLFIFTIILIVTTVRIFWKKNKKPPLLPVEEEKIIKIFNWENYLSQKIIDEFEQKFGVKIKIDTFKDSEEIISALQFQPEKYDLVMAEDDKVRSLKQLKLISELDPQKIPNLKYIKEVIKNNSYDPGNRYCIPYVTGYTGIVINEKYVKDFDGTRKILWDEKYKGKISMINNPAEVLINALFASGHKLKDADLQKLKEAKIFAFLQKELLLGYHDPISQRKLLTEEKAWIAYIYSTEIPSILKENPSLKFFAPKEGVLLWSDNFCLSKDSIHKKWAHEFLNYLLDPKIAAQNSEDIGAPMLVEGIEKFLSNEFIEKIKGLDFPQDEEVLKKSSYRTEYLIKEETQAIINQLAIELGIIK